MTYSKYLREYRRQGESLAFDNAPKALFHMKVYRKTSPKALLSKRDVYPLVNAFAKPLLVA